MRARRRRGLRKTSPRTRAISLILLSLRCGSFRHTFSFFSIIVFRVSRYIRFLPNIPVVARTQALSACMCVAGKGHARRRDLRDDGKNVGEIRPQSRFRWVSYFFFLSDFPGFICLGLLRESHVRGYHKNSKSEISPRILQNFLEN